MSTGLYGDDTSGLETILINGIKTTVGAEGHTKFHAGQLYAKKEAVDGFGYRLYLTDKEVREFSPELGIHKHPVLLSIEEILRDQGWEWSKERNARERRTEYYMQSA
mgnify:CR=1 FL=1